MTSRCLPLIRRQLFISKGRGRAEKRKTDTQKRSEREREREREKGREREKSTFAASYWKNIKVFLSV